MNAPSGWRWFEIDAPLNEWSTGRSPAKVIAAHEALLHITAMPLDVRPGQPLPAAAPNNLVRYLDHGDIRVIFLVTHPIIADGLRLIRITPRPGTR